MAYTFREQSARDSIVVGTLGQDNSKGVLTLTKDRRKPVKYYGDGGFDLCTDGDEIIGFIDSIDPSPNGSRSFGSVQTAGRITAQVVAAGAQLAVNDFVVAATNAAFGTAQAYPQIKKVTKDATLVVGKYWRVISLLGDTGAATKLVLIEPVATSC
jgi:hypothetical protein